MLREIWVPEETRPTQPSKTECRRQTLDALHAAAGKGRLEAAALSRWTRQRCARCRKCPSMIPR